MTMIVVCDTTLLATQSYIFVIHKTFLVFTTVNCNSKIYETPSGGYIVSVSNDLMSTIEKLANLTNLFHMNKTKIQCVPYKKYFASSGNRTRAARVAGEHSTTEPTMLRWKARLPSRNTFQRQHAHAVAELNFQPFSFFSLHSLLFNGH